MKVFFCLISIFAFSIPAKAQNFSANDVSILLEAPFQADDLRLPLPESSLSKSLAAAAAKMITVQADQPGGSDTIPTIGTALLEPENRVKLHIASLRIDPGAPGLHSAFSPFGRNLQVRLVVQPVDMDADQPVRDEALHLVYQFGNSNTSVPGCLLNVTPSAEHVIEFEAVLSDLTALRDDLAGLGVETTGTLLGVHPAFQSAEAASMLIERLKVFVKTHLTQDHLSAISIAGIPDNAPEPWIFMAMKVTGPDSVAPFPSPALAGIKLTATSPQANTRQMLTFKGEHSRRVLPVPAPRNLSPVDCLFNQVFWHKDLLKPGPNDGVSTAELFEPGENSPERAAEVAAVVADPSRSHFFNTDCVSCHTETRREMDADLVNVDVVSAEIAAAEGISEANLPIDPAGIFDAWNIRAFGWFPGFNQTDTRAQATVVRRTARETDEVLACLNNGNWQDLSQPCIARDPVQFGTEGWSAEVRRRFYHTSQGGRIIPATWFNALETSDGGAWFAGSENLESYGLLMSARDEWNPDGWPVGFARTTHEGTDYVSLNCAACHTADVIVGDTRLRVDGAPASFDLDRFAADLRQALSETAQLEIMGGVAVPTSRFQRFLIAIGPHTPELSSDKPAAVAGILNDASAAIGSLALRRPAHPSGPGRVDALTQIGNAIAVSDLGMPPNFAVPNAPTSYPPLWLSDELEYVQYNLAVADPLSRNLGQALGVFGKVELSGDDLFSSSANIEALLDYEKWISMLDVPAWPEDQLGAIDADLASSGKDLFAANCDRCHTAPSFQRTKATENLKGQRFIKVMSVPMIEVGTDPTYVRAFTERWAQSGALRGMPLGHGRSIAPAQPAAQLLGQVVGATARKAVGDKALEMLRLRPSGQGFCSDTNDQEPCGYTSPNSGAGLKAGPLVGVWATGPYLHNGSVRTLYQLLSPPEDRETVFHIGDRGIDIDEIGFLNTDTEDSYLFDTRVPGNGNGGHVFWDEPFSDAEKRALIEYLKDPFRLPFERPDEN